MTLPNEMPTTLPKEMPMTIPIPIPVTGPGYGHPLQFGVSLTPRHAAADAIVALANNFGKGAGFAVGMLLLAQERNRAPDGRVARVETVEGLAHAGQLHPLGRCRP